MGRKEIVGRVISTYQKTVVIQVDRHISHPLYVKIVKKKSKFYAHDEEMKAKVGDTVKIREIKPISRLKRWRVVEIVNGGGNND